MDLAAQLIHQPTNHQSRTHTDHGDQVMSAAVPQIRQSIILRQHGNLRAAGCTAGLFTGPALSVGRAALSAGSAILSDGSASIHRLICRRNSCESHLYFKSILPQQICLPSAGLELLVSQFRIAVNIQRQLFQLRRQFLRSLLNQRSVIIHRCIHTHIPVLAVAHFSILL